MAMISLCVAALVLSYVPAWAQDDTFALDAAIGGTFSSPRFGTEGARYPNNQHITWVLTAPEGSVVSISIPFFELQTSTDCRLDYLELDGTRVCSDSPGYSFVSEGDVATVIFHTNGRGRRTGFTANYMAVPAGSAPAGLVEGPQDQPQVEPQVLVPEPVVVIEPTPMVPDPVIVIEPTPVVPDPVVVIEPTPVVPDPVVVIEPAPVVPDPVVVIEPTPVVPDPVVVIDPGCDEISLEECYEKYTDMKISYGSARPDATTPCACGDLCSASDNCAGFDFNYDVPAYLESQCWLHASSENSDLAEPDMSVAHFRKICE